MKKHLVVLSALLCAWLPLQAAAQAYPIRPITFIWPFAAGSINGEAFRTLATEAGKLLGQPMVTEFRGGAGGRLGVLAATKAPPDGYLVAAALDGVLVVLPQASATFRPEPGRDYAPLLVAAESYSALTAHPSVPFRDVRGLVEYAKANPGVLNYSSPGVGANSHLYFERFQVMTGTQLTHVPYKGSAAAMPDRLNGRIHLAMGGLDVKTVLDTGKLFAVATTGPQREKLYPNTPALVETYPGMVFKSWVGLVAAHGTPPEIVTRLNAAFNTALGNPEVRKVMENAFWVVTPGTSPGDFTARWKADSEAYGPLVKKLGLNLD